MSFQIAIVNQNLYNPLIINPYLVNAAMRSLRNEAEGMKSQAITPVREQRGRRLKQATDHTRTSCAGVSCWAQRMILQLALRVNSRFSALKFFVTCKTSSSSRRCMTASPSRSAWMAFFRTEAGRGAPERVTELESPGSRSEVVFPVARRYVTDQAVDAALTAKLDRFSRTPHPPVVFVLQHACRDLRRSPTR